MAIKKFASIPFSQIADIGIHQNTIGNKLTAAQVKALYNANYVMNLGFYDMTTYNPIMALKVNGTWIVKEGNLEGMSFDKTGIDFCRADDSLRANFVASYPTLIRGGNIADFTVPAGLGGDRGRSGLGIGADYNIMLGCIGESLSTDDYTLQEFAQDMYARDAKCFINVDGGGSSQGIFPDGIIKSTRVVQSFIYIRLYEPVYKVQLGAFRGLDRAIAFRDNCKNALANDGITTTPMIVTTYM